jgi:hypothetical protein
VADVSTASAAKADLGKAARLAASNSRTPGRAPPTTQTYGGDRPHKFCIFTAMGRHILFKCPRLGTNVQHWLPDTPPDEPKSNSYASVVCLACTRLHFIHKETGKLLGED